MKTVRTISAATILFAGLCTPVLADIDVPNLTCGQFAPLSGPEKDQAAREVMLWALSTQNAAAAGTLPNQFNNMTKQTVHSKIDQRCSGQAANANVIARLQATN